MGAETVISRSEPRTESVSVLSTVQLYSVSIAKSLTMPMKRLPSTTSVDCGGPPSLEQARVWDKKLKQSCSGRDQVIRMEVGLAGEPSRD